MTIASSSFGAQSRVVNPEWEAERIALQAALGGRYVLERQLGRGGMGAVYLARDGTLDRFVALKVLPLESLKLPGQREEFLREARTLARLPHDHIVPIHAVDEAGKFVYFTMQYVQGGTLAEHIRNKGRLPVGEVARILREIAWAVRHALQLGVIHRDIKPHNILLDSETGRALVSDFGIARDFTQPPTGAVGGAVGTDAYMSPERVFGQEGDVRSDIYSVGVVGFEAATGVRPFRGNTCDVLVGHLLVPAPPLGVLGEDLDPTLGQVIAKCLAKRPADRFQSPDDLIAAVSMASELRRELPVELRTFLTDSRNTPRLAMGNVILGAWAIKWVIDDIASGGWIWAAVSAGVVHLALIQPVWKVLGLARRAFRAGYSHEDLIHVLTREVKQKSEEPAIRRARLWTKVLEVITWAGAGLFFVGLALSILWSDLPVTLVLGFMSVGAGLALGAGLWGSTREGPEMRTLHWRNFWWSRRGAWAARLAAGRTGRVTSDDQPALPHPSAAALRGARDDALDRTHSTIGRGRAATERLAAGATDSDDEATRSRRQDTLRRLAGELARLEAIAEWLKQQDLRLSDPPTLTAQINAALRIGAVVDAFLDLN